MNLVILSAHWAGTREPKYLYAKLIPVVIQKYAAIFRCKTPSFQHSSDCNFTLHMILPIHCIHYNDVIIRGIASQINGVWIFAQPFVQAQIKENIKAPRYWPLWRKLTVTGGYPSQRANNAKNVSIWCFVCLFQMIDSCQSSTHCTLQPTPSPMSLFTMLITEQKSIGARTWTRPLPPGVALSVQPGARKS